jgi:NDP-sugar pyrophosphorylase family protein
MTSGSESFRAVILAGGRGSRLYPFTASLPKPLLPVGDRPVIELIVRRLALFGASRITVAVNYLADLVESFLGDGRRFGVPIDYVREAVPLGTAGPIGLVEPWKGPLVVTNGDVLSDIDFRQLLKCHREKEAALTVASMVQSLRIDSGVLTTDSSQRVTGILEKPSVEHKISLGTYVLAEHLASLILRNERLEMPELVLKLIDSGERVVAYDHAGFWLDIGRPEDFAQAQADVSIWERMLDPIRTGTAPGVATQ